MRREKKKGKNETLDRHTRSVFGSERIVVRVLFQVTWLLLLILFPHLVCVGNEP